MPFAAYTSDWPVFVKGLLGILIASCVLALADLAAQLLLRLPPVRDMSVRGRKIAGVIGVLGAGIVTIVAGIQEHAGYLFAGFFAGVAAFMFAVRADRA